MCLKSVLMDVSLATVSIVAALQSASTKKLGSTVSPVKVTECVFMQESEQHVRSVKGLQCVFISDNVVNVKIAPKATSQANVLMDSPDQSVEIVVDPHIASIFGSYTSAKIVTEQGSLHTIGEKENVLNAEISQFANIKK